MHEREYITVLVGVVFISLNKRAQTFLYNIMSMYMYLRRRRVRKASVRWKMRVDSIPHRRNNTRNIYRRRDPSPGYIYIENLWRLNIKKTGWMMVVILIFSKIISRVSILRMRRGEKYTINNACGNLYMIIIYDCTWSDMRRRRRACGKCGS